MQITALISVNQNPQYVETVCADKDCVLHPVTTFCSRSRSVWSFWEPLAHTGEQSCFQSDGQSTAQTRLSYNTITSRCPLNHCSVLAV